MKGLLLKGMLGVGLAILLVVSMQGSVQAAKIAVVDTAKVMKEYKKTQQAQERLEKEVEDKKVELKKMETELEKGRVELEKQEGIVSKKKMDQLKKEYMDKQDVFRDKYREVQQVMMSKQKTLMEGILNDIREISKEIAKEKKYELVLDKDSILYADAEEITFSVLKRLNEDKK